MIYLIQQTQIFKSWHKNLKDIRAKFAIARRIDRFESGNFGDTKAVGGGVLEMRIDVGPGYRVYFTIRRKILVILLSGGNKNTQQSDIKRAIELAKDCE